MAPTAKVLVTTLNDESADNGHGGAHRSTESEFTVWTSPLVFRLFWFGILLLHVVCGAYFVAGAYIYDYLPGTVLGGTLDNQSLGLETKHYPLISIMFAMFAALHMLFIASMLLCSLFFGQFTYYIPEDKLPERMRLTGSVTQSGQLRQSGAARMVSSVLRLINSLYGRKGLFGIEGKHFILVFLAREVFETALQTYQAYRLASFVPRPGFVRAFIALVIVNCWSTPLIHRVFGGRPATERLSCLFLDIALDFVSTIVIPVVLVRPYLQTFDNVLTDFPTDLYFDSIWFPLMINELRLVLVASWIDFFSRIMLSSSVLAALMDVKTLLRQENAQHKMHVTPGAAAGSGVEAKYQPKKIDPKPDRITSGPIYDANDGLVTNAKRITYRVLQVLISLLGLVVLILHLQIESRGQSASCLLPVLPWYSSKPACALIALNCKRAGISGTQAEMETVLANLDRRSLEVLLIVQCPDLHIPPTVKEFNELIFFKIFNSTVSSWDADAAFTVDAHPKMRVFVAFFSDFPNKELPAGMLDAKYPPKLRTIQLIGTNIDHLPPALPTIWPPGLIFFWERTPLPAFPEVLNQMVVPVLSLAGANLTELPISFFYLPVLTYLDITGNAFATMPEVPDFLIQQYGVPWQWMQSVDMSATELDTLPSWMASRRFRFLANRTPLCARIAADTLAADEQYVKEFMDCVTWNEIGVFPMRLGQLEWMQ